MFQILITTIHKSGAVATSSVKFENAEQRDEAVAHMYSAEEIMENQFGITRLIEVL
jgi:hypothetical protein